MIRWSLAALLTLTLPASAWAQPGAGTFERVTSFGENPGDLTMHRYSPSPAAPAGAPVVIVLHGCTVDASTMRSLGWEPLADAFGFHVVYPAQSLLNHPGGCFSWTGEAGGAADLRRGEGENRSIISMLDHMQGEHGAAPERAFVMGHSAGGAMPLVMLATWPDRFAGGGVFAAIPYRCADTAGSVACQTLGHDRTPEAWAAEVRAASDHVGPWPRLSIWHGALDTIVNPSNQREILDQWTALHGATPVAEVTSSEDEYTHSSFAGGAVETWRIPLGGHATFVDPGSGCGVPDRYVESAGICAVERLVTFFDLDRAPVDPRADAGPPAAEDASVMNRDSGPTRQEAGAADAGVSVRVDGGDAPMGGGCAMSSTRAERSTPLAVLAVLGLLRRRLR